MAGPKKADRANIPGSEKKALEGSKVIGAVDPNTRLEVTIRVRRRGMTAAQEARTKSVQTLSRAEYADMYGADPADIRKVEAFAHAHGLDVVRSSLSERSVRVAGTAAAMQTAFGVALKAYQYGRQRFRGRIGGIFIPKELSGIVEGVFGLDNRPHARPHIRTARRPKPTKPRAAGGPRPFSPLEVAALYNFPAGVDGSGECIAIIELGGGYRLSDLQAYFQKLGVRMPAITAVSVDGGSNAPTGDPGGPDGEVMLDIEVAGALAPGASIVVYFAPNTDAGFLDALSSAVHDDIRKPSVVSISWGSAERNWTAQSIQAFDSVCVDAGRLGVTVCASAGDSGAPDISPPTRRANVDFPASSPNVLARGGTLLVGSGSRIQSEVVWNEPTGGATGGGVSEVFPLPSYQQGVGVPNSINPGHKAGRGVPDVAGDADPNSGYTVRIDGQDTVVGGTSAVSPLWAGLIALINQSRGRPLGFAHPQLYAIGKSGKAFHDIVQGNNGVRPCPGYQAKAGWDACTGWGSPDGQALLQAMP